MSLCFACCQLEGSEAGVFSLDVPAAISNVLSISIEPVVMLKDSSSWDISNVELLACMDSGKDLHNIAPVNCS